MADATLKKLAQLIDSAGDPVLRVASIKVAAAVGSAKDRALVKGLLGVVKDAEPTLRLAAIDALGQLGAEEALPDLVALVEQGGGELEAAARAAGRLGKRGSKAMARLMAGAAPHLRRRIAAALGHGGTDSAVHGAVQALTDPDPGVVNAAASSLASELPGMTDKQRKTLAGQLLDILQGKPKPALSPVSEAAMMRILSGLHVPQAEEVYWAALDPSRPATLRSAALQALGTLPPPSADGKLKKLLECASDRDFRVVSPALLILQKAPVSHKHVKHWLGLLEAPDVAARKLAVEKLREADTAEVAEALLPQLRHPDRGLRADALAALQQTKQGRQTLLAALLEAESVDEAWSVARAQKETARELTAAQRAKLFSQACDYQDEDDRRADALWFLLRESDPEKTREEIEERATALRKKKDYERGLSYLRLLTRDPACGPRVRFEQAAVALKLSARDTAHAARADDPALAWFGRLLQDTNFDLLAAAGKAKWLDPEDLFYLGFHFAEDTHRPARDFGRGVLELLIKRSPRSTLARNAKSKLKSEGLA